MFNRRGQGTTEYLIILAVIIVIALVVAGVMGWFPGMSGQISESQSKTYWTITTPITLAAWKVTATGTQFEFKNMGADKLTVTDVNVNGTAVSSLGIVLTPGATAISSNMATITCTTGQTYSYNVVITYDVTGGLTGNKLTGLKPIVGTCQ